MKTEMSNQSLMSGDYFIRNLKYPFIKSKIEELQKEFPNPTESQFKECLAFMFEVGYLRWKTEEDESNLKVE